MLSCALYSFTIAEMKHPLLHMQISMLPKKVSTASICLLLKKPKTPPNNKKSKFSKILEIDSVNVKIQLQKQVLMNTVCFWKI